MIAVDLSGSMQATDFTLPDGSNANRLEAVKYVLGRLAAQRPSDRLGLIVFGNAPYLQSPFTDDHQVWTQLLGETEIGMAGQSTAFGDAIGLAIKLFRDSDSDNRVLIILTDGNDTGSMVPPVDAARVAASHAIRIYTIAMGDPATVGEEALDIATLQRVSELTGGRYFQALDQQALTRAYEAIGELEPELYETTSFRPRLSLHWVPVGVALGLYLCYHGFGAWQSWRRLGAARAT
jgi:Ca-activated chloride channel family protein